MDLDVSELEQMTVRMNWATWFETHGHIVDVDGNVVGPDSEDPLKANYMQAVISDMVQWMEEHELPVRILILKPRQRGCSTFSTGGLYHSLNNKPRRAAIIGAKEDQASNLLGMVKTYSARDRFDWGTKRTCKAETAEFVFEDGRGKSSIELLSAKEFDPGRSGTFQFILATEVARWAENGVANASGVLQGLLKCVQRRPGTVVIQETTAKGASGDFHRRWLGAMDPEEYKAAYHAGKLVSGRYVRVFAPWFAFEECCMDLTPEQETELTRELGLIARYTCPELGDEQTLIDTFGLSLGQIAWRRWAIDEECDKDARTFNQDYPFTWETAFLTSGDRVFNSSGMQRLGRISKDARYECGSLEWQNADKQTTIWRPGGPSDGMLWRWEEPVPGARYLISADVATGASQTKGVDPDCHSVFVIRAGEFRHGRGWIPPKTVMRIKPPCRWDLDILDDVVRRMHRYYAGAMIVPEANNPGLALIELMKKWGAPIYRREVYSEVEKRLVKQLGWQTNTATRPALMAAIKKAVRDFEEEGGGFDILCEYAVAQMRAFVRNDKGKEEAMQGEHDDDVLSLAIGYLLVDCAVTYWPPVVRGFVPPELRALEEEDRHRGGMYS